MGIKCDFGRRVIFFSTLTRTHPFLNQLLWIILLFGLTIIIYYVIGFISWSLLLINSLKDFSLSEDKEQDAVYFDSMQPFKLVLIWY